MEEQGNVVLDWRRLWAGGLATAGVAALIAWLGTLICRALLDVEVADSAAALDVTGSFVANYALTAAAFALVATALAHVLTCTIWLATPSRRWGAGRTAHARRCPVERRPRCMALPSLEPASSRHFQGDRESYVSVVRHARQAERHGARLGDREEDRGGARGPNRGALVERRRMLRASPPADARARRELRRGPRAAPQ